MANFMPRLLYARGKGPPPRNKSSGGGGSVARPLSIPQLYLLSYNATAERMTRNYYLFIHPGKHHPVFYFRASAFVSQVQKLHFCIFCILSVQEGLAKSFHKTPYVLSKTKPHSESCFDRTMKTGTLSNCQIV